MKVALLITVVSLVLLAPGASAIQKLPVTVNGCDGSNICVIVRAEPDVCAGVGFGLQGTAACVSPDDGCVRYTFGFRWDHICPAVALP